MPPPQLCSLGLGSTFHPSSPLKHCLSVKAQLKFLLLWDGLSYSSSWPLLLPHRVLCTLWSSLSWGTYLCTDLLLVQPQSIRTTSLHWVCSWVLGTQQTSILLKTLCFEIVDSLKVAKMVQRDPVYSSPSLSQCLTYIHSTRGIHEFLVDCLSWFYYWFFLCNLHSHFKSSSSASSTSRPTSHKML